MSLVPLFFGDVLNDMTRPTRLLDQHFGLGLLPQDLLEPLTMQAHCPMRGQHYRRPWRSALSHNDTGSTVFADKDKFQISLDVQQFAPSEISVKTVDDKSIVIEGKHEEKQDEHGYITRHFVRRYVLPDGHDAKEVVSSLSSDGVLTVTAPSKALPNAAAERVVPISHTGPAKITAKGDQNGTAASPKPK